MSEPLDDDRIVIASDGGGPGDSLTAPPPPAFVPPAKKSPAPMILLAIVATVIVLAVGIAIGKSNDTGPAKGATSTTTSTDDVLHLALQVLWDGQTPSNQRSMCVLWRIDPDELLTAVAENWDETHSSSFPRDAARTSFGEQC